CASHFRLRWPSCLQMIRQGCAAKDETGAELLRISGINSAQSRRQQIIGRAFANDAPAPFANRFKLSRPQRARANTKPQRHLKNFGDAQWNLFWFFAIDEALAPLLTSWNQRHTDISAHRLEPRGIKQAIRRCFYQTMR